MSAGREAGPPPLPMFAEDAFPSRARHPVARGAARLAARRGHPVCFATGLISHLHQHPVAWLPLPAGPVWGYRATQGLHVATGLASIPLFVAKLWSVYPTCSAGRRCATRGTRSSGSASACSRLPPASSS